MWDFSRHRSLCSGKWTCGAFGGLGRNDPGSCRQGERPHSADHGPVSRNWPRFADHVRRTAFWLHDVDTNTAGLPYSYSEHLRRESYAVLTASSELNYIRQNTLWKRITGPMSRCSLPPQVRSPIFRGCLE